MLGNYISERFALQTNAPTANHRTANARTTYLAAEKIPTAAFVPPAVDACETLQRQFSVRCCSAAKSLLAVGLGRYFDVYATRQCRDVFFRDRSGLVHSVVLRERLGRSFHWRQPWVFRIWCDRGISQPRKSALRQLGSTRWAGIAGTACSLRLSISPHEIRQAVAWGVEFIASQLGEAKQLRQPPFKLDSNFGQIESGYLWSQHAADAADLYYEEEQTRLSRVSAQRAKARD